MHQKRFGFGMVSGVLENGSVALLRAVGSGASRPQLGCRGSELDGIFHKKVLYGFYSTRPERQPKAHLISASQSSDNPAWWPSKLLGLDNPIPPQTETQKPRLDTLSYPHPQNPSDLKPLKPLQASRVPFLAVVGSP